MNSSSHEGKRPSSWRQDYFAACEVMAQWWGLWLPIVVGLAALPLGFLAGCHQSQSPAVVVYAAQDQVYAEPMLKQFTRQTGIHVRAVYDSEAVKTVGIVNRLLAERDHPQCDVFWGNEELRTRQLAARGIFRATNGWAAFGYRSRRLVINTNQLKPTDAPRSLLELTNARWRGKIAMAYPLFGTTATHFQALRQSWGATNWTRWCAALAANQPLVVDGNSVVVQMVGRGEAWLGLTDSDDIAAGQRAGLPVAALPMSRETLLIPNTVAVIAHSPNPESAQQLFAYLQNPDVAQRLVHVKALEGLSVRQVGLGTLRPDWAALLRDLDKTTEQLKTIFLR